jgi:dihydroorotate dehydrogenase (fumarate)
MPAERHAIDLGATIAGVRFPFCAMNVSGAWSSTASELRALARSETGAVVLRTTTLHPFLHPSYRSLHNPGYDKLLPLVRELAEQATCPVVASIAGATADEYATLARAFAEAGAAMIEANLADPWVTATLDPWDEREAFRRLLAKLSQGATVPVAVKLPARVGVPYGVLAALLAEAGIRVVVTSNDFAGLEKLRLEGGADVEPIAVGDIHSGYDVSRALSKGARAVQVDTVLVSEGPAIFARLGREMRVARGGRPE